MKIGIVVFGSIEQTSGGYFYDRQLIQALQKADCDMEIISLRDRGWLLNLFGPDKKSKEILKKGSFDSIIQDQLCHSQLMLWNLLRRKPSVPVIVLVHHLKSKERRSFFLNFIIRWVERIHLKYADAFWYNSFDTKASVESLKVGPKPFFLSLPGRDDPPFVPRKEKSNCAFLSVGSVIPRKGYHLVIRALRSLGSLNWTWDIVGPLDADPHYASRLQSQIRSWGYEERIIFHDRQVNLDSFWDKADAFVLTSSHEGFGIAVLEASIRGIPSIVGNAGGVLEIIEDEFNGFLVPTQSGKEKLVSALFRMITDGDLRIRIGKNARSRALEHPLWSSTFEKAIDEFKKWIKSSTELRTKPRYVVDP